MKVIRLHGVGDLRLNAESLPVAGTGEVLLRVTAVGLCGSDLHWLSKAAIGDAQLVKPLVLGHEFAGMIESGERRGERVAVDPAVPCGACEYCQEGLPNLCPNLRFAGHSETDGALREYLTWPVHCLHRLPESLTDSEGAMLEPVGIALHAVDLAHVKPGMTVGVFGCGPIGLLVLQVAKVAGAVEIITTDKLVHRLEAAQTFGATAVFQASNGEEIAQVLAATRQRGVDVAFEAGEENEAVEAAIAAARPGGRVVLIGIPADDRTTFTASVARRKGLTIKLARRMKYTYPRAIRLVERGLVDVRSLVTHRFPLKEFNKAFSAAQKREGLKVIIEP
ncbi:alcohol dehydrogenase catalytic domain-containing protein [Acidobacteria bacterium AH-259-O06]|nr:alcohol dehydrogenase catalytic domain-containing protein [Acidobacteria bacterium AH-259-O06]